MSLLDTKVDNIYIVAKGPTWFLCPDKDDMPERSELWGLNSTYYDRPDVDRLFILHDIRGSMLWEDQNLVPEINKLGVPIYTAGPYKVLDNHREYPAEQVVKHFGIKYMLNAICWMLAAAIIIGPKKIWLYGADYAFGVDLNERSCTEFWLGMALGRGVDVELPQDSHLLKPPELRQPLYGYVVDRHMPDGLLQAIPADRKWGNLCAPNYKLVPIGEEI